MGNFLDGAGREEARCLEVLLCLVFTIFGWEDGIAQAGKVKMKNVFLCMALEIEPRLFYFSKSQSLKYETHDSFLLCI